jgi:hypothetical protein
MNFKVLKTVEKIQKFTTKSKILKTVTIQNFEIRYEFCSKLLKRNSSNFEKNNSKL